MIADPNAAALLVRASRDGDRSAFGTLYSLYSRMVHAIAIARVGPAEADDIVQDVFLTAMKQLHALRDESKAKTWLFTTLYREFLRLRRQGETAATYVLPQSARSTPRLP